MYKYVTFIDLRWVLRGKIIDFGGMVDLTLFMLAK